MGNWEEAALLPDNGPTLLFTAPLRRKMMLLGWYHFQLCACLSGIPRLFERRCELL